MSPSLAGARNYYAWIGERMRPYLGRRVLDIGGGHGALLDHVVDASRRVTSIDLSPACVAEMESRFPGAAFEARVGDITDPSVADALAKERYDTILCVNVLEHIRGDADALRSMAGILRPAGGRLLLLVPAHPLLYGSPDRLAGHFRRYSRASLRSRLVEAGFRVEELAFFNSFGAVPYFVNSRLIRPRSLSGAVDTQIIWYDRYFIPVLRRLEANVRLPFGQSLIAVGRMEGGSR
jgi:SAM-dependent methyltransferase